MVGTQSIYSPRGVWCRGWQHLSIFLSLSFLSSCLSIYAQPSQSWPSKALAALGNAARRKLSSDDGIWKIPPNPDSNYSDWRQQFDDRLEATCLTFHVPSQYESGVEVDEHKPSQHLFQSLITPNSLDEFEEVVYTEFHSISSYIGTKAGWIAYICIGVVFLILGIVWMFSLKHCCRKRCARCSFFSCCKDHHRAHTKFNDRPICTGLVVIVFLGAFLLSFGIVCIVKAVNFEKGISATVCDGYISLKAFWFGSEVAETKPDTVTNWKGTHPQWEELHYLLDQVTPGPDNPVRKLVVETYEKDVKFELQQACELYMNKCATMNDYIQEVMDAIDKMVKDLGVGKGEPTTKVHLGYGKLAIAKLNEFSDDLNATTKLGIDVMEANIDLYLGDDSLLFHESFVASKNALMSVDDVNSSIGKLVQLVADVEPIVNGLRIAAIAAFSIWGILALLLFIGGFAIYYFMYKAHWKRKPPHKRVTTGMGGLFVCLVLFGSISLIVSGALFLANTVGGDACQYVKTSLIADGKFETMPTSLWNETLYDSTDMRAVLTTCMQEDGDGDVATTLGLTATLDRMEQSLEKTKTEIRDQVEQTLDLTYKISQADAIRIMMQQVAYYWWPNRDQKEYNYMVEDLEELGFPAGTRYVIPTLYPDHITPDLEPFKVLCVLPLFGVLDGGMTELLGGVEACLDDLVVNMIGTETLMKIISAKAAAGQAKTPGENVKSTWCMKSLEAQFPCPSGGVMIDTTWKVGETLTDRPEVKATMEAVADAYPNSENEAKKWLDALTTAVHWENILNYEFDLTELKADLMKCPGGTTKCTVAEFWPEMYRTTSALGQELYDDILHTADVVNEFVEGVTIKSMDDLLGKARSALDDFNCQFFGTSMVNGMVYGLCSVTLPSGAMLAFLGSMFFIACFISAVVTWMNWHDLHCYFKHTISSRKRFSGYDINCKAAATATKGRNQLADVYSRSFGSSSSASLAHPDLAGMTTDESGKSSDLAKQK